jgi:hypothetical protein
MKRIFLISILITQWFIVFAQSDAQGFKKTELKSVYLSNKELKAPLTKYDFSKIFTHTENPSVYGFIGENFQRIRIKFITIKRDSIATDIYHVYGKSMVKSTIDEFQGTIKISNIRKFKETSNGLDNEFKNKGIKGQYIIIGDYRFEENNTQAHSGLYKGNFKSEFYIDKNDNIKYDDIDSYADGYSNNQYVGEWISYDNKLIKKCNWGDFRIPNSSKFDIGTGEFSPSDQYLKYGWQSIRDLVSSNKKVAKRAKQIENTQWWK